jgi:NADPH:quinone reductase-like Zn-dependent oxidoreductase
MRMGLIPKKKIFGADVAGIIESVGKNIRQFKIGDEVLGDLASYGFGGLAEYALAPENLLVHKPRGVTFDDAASISLAALTALQALQKKGDIREGTRVLILGSSGGVGSFAVQLAKHFGATVTAVCSSRNLEQSRMLGADFVLDYTKQDVVKSNQKYELILAINGNYSLLGCKRLLTNDGVYVMVGGDLQQIFKVLLFGRFLSFGHKKMRFLAAKANQKDLEMLANLVSEGKVKPLIEERYTLELAPEAMQKLNKGHARGKVVINIG